MRFGRGGQQDVAGQVEPVLIGRATGAADLGDPVAVEADVPFDPSIRVAF